MRDGINSKKIINALGYAATTGDRTGEVIDVRGYDAATITAQVGTVTTASATHKFTLDLYHGDLASGTDGTSVGASERIGLATDVDDTTDADKTVAFGYLGNKRYIHLKVTETGTASVLLGATAVLEKAARLPEAGADLN
jgi:hypothetical protein